MRFKDNYKVIPQFIPDGNYANYLPQPSIEILFPGRSPSSISNKELIEKRVMSLLTRPGMGNVSGCRIFNSQDFSYVPVKTDWNYIDSKK